MQTMRGAAMELIKERLQASYELKRQMLEHSVPEIKAIADAIIASYRKGGKVLVCGCGGSAADSQHMAAELVCKLAKDRDALPAIALTANTSILTAWSNDIGFDTVFSRQVEALAQPGDVVIGITTSGNSPSILNALDAARKKGAMAIGLTGRKGGKLPGHADLLLRVPSDTTQHIQEGHLVSYHIICELVENEFSKP